jgi:arsenate reductase (glutaredoxin)
MTVTIYHNPNCGTSRNVLAMIRQSGQEPVVIEYLKNPPTRQRLKELIAAMGISVRALLRDKGTPYAELGLADPQWTDDQLLDFMMAHPILINRPIVVTPKGVRLCRPSEGGARHPAKPKYRAVRQGGRRGCQGWSRSPVSGEQSVHSRARLPGLPRPAAKVRHCEGCPVFVVDHHQVRLARGSDQIAAIWLGAPVASPPHVRKQMA